MRKKIAAGNWKMNLDYEQATTLAKNIAAINIPDDVTVIMGVPALYLKDINKIAEDNGRIFVSAQNIHQKEYGAYTGEISAPMLKSIDIPYVIIGHSERRQYNCETEEILKEKVSVALGNNLDIIFCCGEPLDIRKAGTHEDYVKNQLVKSLSGFTTEDMKKITIAYEPIWAIGTGETASPQQAQDMHKSIRNVLADMFGKVTAQNTAILYGGSVKPSNAKQIFSQEDVDGGLVGGASLKADMFEDIIMSFE